MGKVFIIFCFITCYSFSQTVVSENSKVTFRVSNMAVNNVKGTIKGMEGVVNLEEDHLESSFLNICIDASTINTKNKKRDEHLKNKDFLDVTNYPEICFKSTNISKQADSFIAKGKLTMHGVTKEIEIPFTYKNNTIDASLKLQRLHYKIGEATSSFMVGKEIEIKILCILNQKNE